MLRAVCFFLGQRLCLFTYSLPCFVVACPYHTSQEWHYSKLFNPLTNQIFQLGFVVTVTQEASMKVGAKLQQKAEKMALSSALIAAQAHCLVKAEIVV